MYCVISCDIIDSKKIADIDNIVKEKINYINKDILNKNYITKISLSRGDEMQVVLEYSNELFSNIRKIRYALLPIKLRIGIGVGSIGKINYENSWEMNGEAFHNAREALEKIAKERETSTHIIGVEAEKNEMLNSFYLLADIIIDKWSHKSWEAATIYEEEKTILATADKLKITNQSASERVKKSNIKKILLVEEKIKSFLG